VALNGRQRIVVLGGGSGGVVAATSLGRRLGAAHDVTLIDRRADHVYMPAFLSLMIGERRPRDITRPLDRLARRNVRVITGEIEGIDLARQEVRLADEVVPYDHLVISLGLQTRPEAIPGFTEAANHAWEMDAALRLQEKLARFEGGRVVIGVPPGPFRCPPAPYEAQYVLHDYFVRRGVRSQVKMDFFTRDPMPRGPAHDPAIWMDAHARRRGITQHYSFAVESIDPERRVVQGRFGLALDYDLLFLVPPHEPARVLVDSHIADSVAGVRVDFDTLETRWENVYAIGDCADVPASKAGVVAHQEADVVAHNIAVKITGRGDPQTLRLHTM